MRLRIEPPDGGRTGPAHTTQESAQPADAFVLDVVMQPQLLGKWCWAAIAASLAGYYGACQWQQHEIASALLGCDCARYTEVPELAARCDQYARLDAALRLTGCYSHWSPGRPSIERIQVEIALRRPICLSLDWYQGGSHYIVVTGYHASARELYVQDPLHGSALVPFHQFPHRYQVKGGAWRGTFWTRPPDDL